MEHFIEDEAPNKPTLWQRVVAWFKSSETIFWARLNALVGAVATAATFIDPSLLSSILTPQTFAIYVLVNGVATEYLRRRRAPNLGEQQ
jgi:hypothetical protein